MKFPKTVRAKPGTLFVYLQHHSLREFRSYKKEILRSSCFLDNPCYFPHGYLLLILNTKRIIGYPKAEETIAGEIEENISIFCKNISQFLKYL